MSPPPFPRLALADDLSCSAPCYEARRTSSQISTITQHVIFPALKRQLALHRHDPAGALSWNTRPPLLIRCRPNSTTISEITSTRSSPTLLTFFPRGRSSFEDVLIRMDLSTMTGLPGCSLQPNSGAQGEYAGLSVTRAYHHSRGDEKRDICLVPVSAHGTNPAVRSSSLLDRKSVV